jgi:TM2 domain-containing membrane protein YozV
MRHKSPGTAILLSLFLPGAGQFYVGQTGRGVAFFCAAVVAYILIIALIGLILVPMVVIWAAVDANKLANAYNAQLLAGVPLT